MQSQSEREIRSRLPEIVAAVREVARANDGLEFVNGGGTGSLARTAAAGIVTELTAGSGFYAPALFDNYRSLELEPAAFFCLPVVRRPVGGVATLLGGGYLASGPASADRLPEPYLPGGLRFDRQEGAGEVQTPVLGAAAYELRVGDRVYLRHAKAGELCERFDRLLLVEGERDRRRGPYVSRRGEGVPLMARIDVDKSLTAPIEEVFELLTDHAGYTRFRGFTKAELVREGTPDPNGLGALRRLVVGPLRFTEEITAFERPTRMDYLIREVNLPLEHDGGSIKLVQDGAGTRVHWTSVFTMPVPVVGSATAAGLAVAIRRGFIRLLDDIDRLA